MTSLSMYRPMPVTRNSVIGPELRLSPCVMVRVRLWSDARESNAVSSAPEADGFPSPSHPKDSPIVRKGGIVLSAGLEPAMICQKAAAIASRRRELGIVEMPR